MQIIPYTIAITNDLLTGRGGLVCAAELLRRIGFSAWVERYFPKPGSNRGYAPAEVVTLWMLMLHEGARSLEDVQHLREDKALHTGKIYHEGPFQISIAEFGNYFTSQSLQVNNMYWGIMQVPA